MVETDMLSKLFLRRRKRRGSALVLSIILSMLMVILCSTIMMFTLQNFRTSKTYADMNAGYYSSEQRLESGLKFLQNFLKDCDTEAMNYVNNKGFIDGTGTGVNYSLPTDIVEKYHPDTANLTTFYTNVNSYWNARTKVVAPATTPDWDPKNGDEFNRQVANFSDEVYVRYYFILLKDIMEHAHIDETKIKDEDNQPYGTATNESFKDFFTKNSKLLNSSKSEINLVPNYAGTNYADLLDFVNDSSTGKLKTLADIFTASTGSGIGKEYTNKQNIEIKYVKNADAKDEKGKSVKEKTINTEINLIPPAVHFIVSNKINYVPLIDNFNPIVANAATAMNTINVEGSNVVINGDVRAGDSTTSTTPLASTDDYMKHIYKKDINTGGVDIKKDGNLTVNGNLYTNGYVHTVGDSAKLTVKPYSLTLDEVNAFTGLKGLIGMADISRALLFTATGAPDETTPYETTFDSKGKIASYKAKNYTYVSDHSLSGIFSSDTAAGGDVFCKRLKTEGNAPSSNIEIQGRAVVDGSIQADGASSKIKVDQGYYGLNSGNGADSNGISNGDHSCIVQNAKDATIGIGGNIYVPSRTYVDLTKSGASATKDYFSAESISLPKGSTLDAYANKTSYMQCLPGLASLTASSDYKPFSLYNFVPTTDGGYISDAVKNQWKSFLSYFKDTIDPKPLPKSGVSITANGYIEGIGVTSGDKIVMSKTLLEGKPATPGNPATPGEISSDPKSSEWYDSSKISEIDDSSDTLNNIISNKDKIKSQIFNTKTYNLYSDRIRFTARYFDDDNNLHDKTQTGKYYDDSSLAKVSNNLIIADGDVNLDVSTYPDCDFKDETLGAKTIKVFQGIIIAKNITIPDGYGVSGMVVANGDITLKGNNIINYVGPKVSMNGATDYPSETDTDLQKELTNKVMIGGTDNYLYENPIAAEAMGLNVKIIKKADLKTFSFKSAYHVDNMSRFKRTEWEQDDN